LEEVIDGSGIYLYENLGEFMSCHVSDIGNSVKIPFPFVFIYKGRFDWVPAPYCTVNPIDRLGILLLIYPKKIRPVIMERIFV